MAMRHLFFELPPSILFWLIKLRNFSFHFCEKRKNVGKRSYISPSAQIIGWKNVRIGKHSTIGEDVWINANHRDKDEISISIGDNCVIGRRNFITSGDLVRIGDYCLSGVDCRFLGADHIYTSPFVPYISSGVTEGGRIEIGTNCFFGSGVTVLKGVKVGYGCIIGAATVVTRDIPPLSVVVGNPCRVVKRFDMELNVWINAKEYDGKKDKALPSEIEYLEKLKEKIPIIGPAFYAATRKIGDR